MSSINLFEALPSTVIQLILSKTHFSDLNTLYNLNYQARLSILDLIYIGKIHVIQGIAYLSGKNTSNRLVIDPMSSIYPSVPSEVNIDRTKHVIQVSAGYNHSLFLMKDGTVYAYGSGLYGRLGNGTNYTERRGIPTRINTTNIGNKRVINVSAGQEHSLFVCEDGTVYASGNGRNGRLGDGRTDNHIEKIPIQINIDNIGNKMVIKAEAGHDHSLFLCKDGTVYASGQNINGQLGIGRYKGIPIGTPTQIKTKNIGTKKVIEVTAGFLYSLFLCEDGTVYGSGYGELGVLGDGARGNYTRPGYNGVTIPRQIKTTNFGDKRVINVSAGYEHSLFVCEDGTVYTSGNGKDGKLGDGQIDNHYELIPIQINQANLGYKRVIEVSAGTRHSLFLCEDGTVYTSGKDVLEDDISLRKINTINIGDIPVIQVSAGSEHSLFLT